MLPLIRAFSLSVILISVISAASFSSSVVAETETAGRFAEDLRDNLVLLLDADAGKGTGEMARYLRELATKVNQSAAKVETDGVTLDDIRAFVLEGNDGKTLEIPVNNFPDAIDRANSRLLRTGIDFIRIVKGADPVTPMDKALPKDEERYAKLAKIRDRTSPPLALVGSWMGNGFGLAGLAQGLVGFRFEKHFIKHSAWWATKVWDRLGFPGNIAVNAGYGIALYAVLTAAEMVIGSPISTTWEAFVVKTLVGTATFVGSFGAMQVAAAKLRRLGEFSEFGRFKLETYSVFLNMFGRSLALGAGKFGVDHVVASFPASWVGFSSGAVVNFGVGEAIGWGIQAAYFFAITGPMWTKILLGDKSYDFYTKRLWEPKGPNRVKELWNSVVGSCARALGGVANVYTPARI